jgi:hypothetical protein
MQKKAAKALIHKRTREKKAQEALGRATTGLSNGESAFFYDKERRTKLVELGVLKILVPDFDVEVYDTPLPKETWAYKKQFPIELHPLVLYIYRHLARKYKHRAFGIISKDIENSFWETVEAWVSGSTTEDNIVGIFELEKESFTDDDDMWSTPRAKFQIPQGHVVKPSQSVNYFVQSGAIDPIVFTNPPYSYGKHFVQTTHDVVTVECPDGKELSRSCPLCELQAKAGAKSG